MQTPTPGTDARIYAGGYDLSAFFKGSKLSQAAKTVDAATFADTHERPFAVQRSGSVSLDGLFEGSVGAVDERLAAGLAVNNQVITVVASDVLGGVARGMRAAGTAYDISGMAVDGIVQVSGALFSNVGLERVLVSHPMGAEAAPASGGVIDNVAQSLYGLVGYLQVKSITGAGLNCTVKIADSANGSAYADLLTFAVVTEPVFPVAERKIVAGAIRQYLRWTISGTFTTVTFQLSFGRGSVARPYA